MFHVFKTQDVPDVYKIKGSKHMLDLVLISKIRDNCVYILGADEEEYLDLYYPRPKSASQKIDSGLHGFDDITEGYSQEGNYPDVRAMFMAIGPDFKKGYSQPWIKIVDEYQIMMKVLDIEPLENEGNMERVQSMFNVSNQFTLSIWLFLTMGFVNILVQ